MDRFDDVVGAAALHVGQAVQSHNHHAACRQQPDDPRVHEPQLSGALHADVEGRAHHAADETHAAADAQPFGQRDDVEGNMLKKAFDAFHSVLLFVSFRHFNTLFICCQSHPVGGLYEAVNIYNCKISFVLDNFYDIISANICYVEEVCYEYRKKLHYPI